MDKKKFANKIKEIEMPKDMQQRIIKNCLHFLEFWLKFCYNLALNLLLLRKS